jgi:hypothetical protein
MRLNRRATYPPSLAPTPAPVESPKAKYLIDPVIGSLNLLREMSVSPGVAAPLCPSYSPEHPAIKTSRAGVLTARIATRIICIVHLVPKCRRSDTTTISFKRAMKAERQFARRQCSTTEQRAIASGSWTQLIIIAGLVSVECSDPVATTRGSVVNTTCARVFSFGVAGLGRKTTGSNQPNLPGSRLRTF